MWRSVGLSTARWSLEMSGNFQHISRLHRMLVYLSALKGGLHDFISQWGPSPENLPLLATLFAESPGILQPEFGEVFQPELGNPVLKLPHMKQQLGADYVPPQTQSHRLASDQQEWKQSAMKGFFFPFSSPHHFMFPINFLTQWVGITFIIAVDLLHWRRSLSKKEAFTPLWMAVNKRDN